MNEMLPKSSAEKAQPTDLVVALDIGTTKVCAIAGRRNTYGGIEILGMGKVRSEGVNRGVVSNIDKTVKAITAAIEMAEQKANVKFKKVQIGIAGQHIKSIHHHGISMRDDALEEIKEHEIDKLVKDMHKLVLPPGDKIIHVIPQEFTVDDEMGIIDPVGMSGGRLEANFHIITGQIAAARNMLRCVEKAGLEVTDITLEPIASATAVLKEEEKEAGVIMVDIGGGTTDITIFKDGIIRHTAVIPFGGNIITNDIKEGCMVLPDQAEKLKVRFGSALADEIYDNRIITISSISGRDPKEISEKNLSRIIQARVEEIFDYVMLEIHRSGFERKLFAGMVLTGGGSLLKNVNHLAEKHTGLHTRIGKPIEHLSNGYDDSIQSPIYSTGIGLLIYAIKHQKYDAGKAETKKIEENEEVEHEDGVSPFSFKDRIVNSIKNLFEPVQDSEF